MFLRPHHLLCIQKYTGHGYNGAFTAHMNRLTASLASDTDITIVDGTDDICAACPNRAEGHCRSEEKVRRMDCAVLQSCGITAGTTAKWQDLATTARNTILLTDAFREICSACNWYELCQKTEV